MKNKTKKPLVTLPHGSKHSNGIKEATVMQYHVLMDRGHDTRWNILTRLGKGLTPRVSSSTIWNWVNNTKRLSTKPRKTTKAIVNTTNNIVRSHNFVESVNIRTLDGSKVCLTFEDIERISRLAGTNC